MKALLTLAVLVSIASPAYAGPGDHPDVGGVMVGIKRPQTLTVSATPAPILVPQAAANGVINSSRSNIKNNLTTPATPTPSAKPIGTRTNNELENASGPQAIENY